MKKDVFYPSSGQGKIHAAIWEPDGEVKGIVQIVHGIAEHVDRYDDFAQFLNQSGYLVAAEDHMGHGKSAQEDTIGCFSGGWFCAVKDTKVLHDQLLTAYPNKPFILLGHSMGSFMARTLLTFEDFRLDGCILSGTAWMPNVIIGAGKLLCKIICTFKGSATKSAFLQNMMFGGYTKRIPEKRTEYDWLSTDPIMVQRYVEDSMCGFLVSAGLLRDMLNGLSYIQKRSNLMKMDKCLPVHFASGKEDPVGDYGKGVTKAAARFKNVGLTNVTCKLYDGRRHELLNEDIRQTVYADFLSYIDGICCE